VLYVGSFAIPDGWPELVFRPTLWAIAAALVILYGMLPHGSGVKKIFFRIVSWRPIQIIGLASYSIYLIHFELRALIVSLVGDDLPIGVVRVVVIITGVAAGVAIYYVVEVPASRIGRPSAKRRTTDQLASVKQVDAPSRSIESPNSAAMPSSRAEARRLRAASQPQR
jgi:peptidoglycan/LPS O-acetylase OafA/YrhL